MIVFFFKIRSLREKKKSTFGEGRGKGRKVTLALNRPRVRPSPDSVVPGQPEF